MKRTLLSLLLMGVFFFFGANVAHAQVMTSTDGAVRLSWLFRGGSCTINYTDAEFSGYLYQTSTSCDNGQIMIGGLQPGKKYRFVVGTDNGMWSRPVFAVARAMMPEVTMNSGVQPQVWTDVNGNGAVRLNWTPTDGQVWVKYTEAKSNDYHYWTVANAGDGGVTIGSLVPGRWYKFRLSRDGVNWSRVVKFRAYTVTMGW